MVTVLKCGDVKFHACPMRVITPKTWRIIEIVNDTIDGDGNVVNPYYGGAWADQPAWLIDAVHIVRRARAKHRQETMSNGK